MATFGFRSTNDKDGARLRVMHVITGLGTGGAEAMLSKLLSAIDRQRFSPAVVSLTDEGTVGSTLSALDVPVYCLKVRRNIPNPVALLRLRGLIRNLRPNLIQGWMYHGNLAATLANQGMNESIPVIWNVRQSLYDPGRERLLTRGVIRLSARLSEYSKRILYNSRTSAAQHEARGFAADRTLVIPNGFDLARFQPNKAARQSVRRELGIDNAAVVVGVFARYHPMKDHENFIRAAAALARDPCVHFLLAGTGIDRGNGNLARRIVELGLDHRVHLLGERRDVYRLLASLDVLCSSSAWGEGFPNVVGEAMACGVPCVVTDVGDSAHVVGNTGKVVVPGDPEALTDALREFIEIDSESRQRLGAAARQRIAKYFSIEQVARQYQALYAEVLNRVRNRGSV